MVIVHHDEDNREEYDIDDDDDDDGDTPPLKFHNSSNSAIGLPWGEGNNTARIRRKRRTVGGAAAISKRGQIDLYAVSERGELDDDSQTTKYEKRNPKVRKTVRVVDMAGFYTRLARADDNHGSVDIPPNRYETPLNTMAIARATAGTPQPPTKAPHITNSHPRQLIMPLS